MRIALPSVSWGLILITTLRETAPIPLSTGKSGNCIYTKRYKTSRSEGLRRYTPADWETTGDELTRQLFQHHRALQNAPPFSAQDARDTVYGWLSRRDVVLWVWQEDGRVVGLARARHDGVCFFEEFVVAEERRGQGIGARFLAALEDNLREAGERDVFLSMVWPGNPGAIDFYRRHGYDLLNTFELRKGLDEDRRGREIEFLGRRFHLADSNHPPGRTGTLK